MNFPKWKIVLPKVQYYDVRGLMTDLINPKNLKNYDLANEKMENKKIWLKISVSNFFNNRPIFIK